MEIVIIILLLILVSFFVWDRLRARQRWKEQGDTLTKIVGEKVEGSVGVFGDVRQRLGELTEKTKAIEEVGKNLSRLQELLRSPKFKGELGEVGLETLLMNYFPGSYGLQHRFQNGKTVDAVLHVGENKVPIDSKLPMEDFERMVAAESEKEQAILRKQFIRTVKKHIDEVSEYIQPQEGTFNFALLYVRAENLYYEMVAGSQPSEGGDICSYCREKKVFLVSPSTFHAYLQSILLGLKGVQIEKFARDILGHLERLQGALQAFEKDFEIIGRHISDASKRHAKAATKLTTLGDQLEFLTSQAPTKKLPEGSAETGEEGE